MGRRNGRCARASRSRRDHEVGSVGQADHDPGDPRDRGRAAWGDDRLSADGRAFSPGSPRTRPKTTARPSGDGATPYWRTLKSGGYLNEKYPGGVPAHKEKLEAEGHDIVQRGQKYAVADYERYLVNSDETD